MLRITLVQGAFLPVPPLLGGAVEKRWFALAKVFARRGHGVTQISRLYGNLPTDEVVDRVRHIRVSGSETPSSLWRLKWRDLLYTRRVLSVLPEADILVSNTFFLPILCRAPSRGALYVDVARTPRGQMRFYTGAARLRANSSAVAAAIVRECPAAEDKVRVIPNPLPFVPAETVDGATKEKLVLYAGRVHPEKGIELLLRAFAKASSEGLSDWSLDIAGAWETAVGGGGEAYFMHLQSMAQGLPVRWHGLVRDTDQLNRLYRRARLFCYPSLAEKGETFGLAPLEAMAWGCLPVVSDLACFRDFIDDGENGMVFNHRADDPVRELANKMLAAGATDGGNAAMAKKAMGVRESHSLERVADLFLQDFRNILKT